MLFVMAFSVLTQKVMNPDCLSFGCRHEMVRTREHSTRLWRFGFLLFGRRMLQSARPLSWPDEARSVSLRALQQLTFHQVGPVDSSIVLGTGQHCYCIYRAVPLRADWLYLWSKVHEKCWQILVWKRLVTGFSQHGNKSWHFKWRRENAWVMYRLSASHEFCFIQADRR